MNSIGIPEGYTFKEEMPECTCVWVTLLSIPAKHRLEKKCDYCKEQELKGDSNEEHTGDSVRKR